MDGEQTSIYAFSSRAHCLFIKAKLNYENQNVHTDFCSSGNFTFRFNTYRTLTTSDKDSPLNLKLS